MTRSLPVASLCTISLCYANLALADTPLGWIGNENPSAYTIDAMKFEVSIGAIAVNEDIDFLDIRDDLLAGARQLGGNSGDLSGNRAELQVGITSSLSAFYRRQQSDLTIELGDINSINLLSIDDALKTTSTAYGFKWNFYGADFFDNSKAWRAASLEVTRTENSTDNFIGSLDRVTLSSSLVVNFLQPQTFSIQNMDDEGWQARLLYSFPLSDSFTGSVWAGYAENDSEAGTGSSIPVPSLASAFEQSFTIENQQILIGASMNWQITPRLPLQLSYEYLQINNSESTVTANPSNVLLPSFLRANNLNSVDADSNHSLKGSLSYWITPQFNVALTAKLFSNQFLGIIPH